MAVIAFDQLTYDDVEQILNSALSLITGNNYDSLKEKHNQEEDITSYIRNSIGQNILKKIESMIKEIDSRIEKTFGSKQNDLNVLGKCYKEWSNAYSTIFSQMDSSYLNDYYVFDTKNQYLLSEDELPSFDELINDFTQEEVYPYLTNFIKQQGLFNKITKVELAGGQIILTASAVKTMSLDQNEGFIGKGASLRVDYSYDNKTQQMTIRFKASDRRKKFLQKYENLLLEKEYLNIKKQKTTKKVVTGENKITVFLEDPIVNMLTKKATFGKYFKQGLDKIGGEIAITASSSGFMGAMGEAYWYGFFDYLSDKGFKLSETAARAAGVNLKTRAGQEVPIDIIFKNLGVQVKNLSSVTVSPKKVRLTKQSNESFLSFLSNPGLGSAGLPSGDIDILGKFFFAANYNKPNDDKFSGPAFERYKNLYGYVEAVYNQKQLFVESLLPKIISIDKDLSITLRENIDTKIEEEGHDVDKLYVAMPDLFAINEKLYYSSDLLKDLADLIKNSISRGEIGTAQGSAFNFTGVKLDLSPFETDRIFDYPMKVDPRGLLDSSLISFTLTFNFNIPDVTGNI